MARAQTRSRRKASGGRYSSTNPKTKSNLAGFPANTKLGEAIRRKITRILGGNKKQSTLSTNKINVTDKKGKTQVTDILNVIENPANPHLVRRNILTKGAVVETKLGKAKVTSRPGQEGTINGKLI